MPPKDTRNLSAVVPKELADSLDAFCERRDVGRHKIIEKAIRAYLEARKPDEFDGD